VAVVSSRVAMSTGQEAVTPQKPPGGGSVAPSPAALSPVSKGEFLTTIKALSRGATRVWAVPSQITARVTRKFSLMLCCGVLAAQAPHGYFDEHHQQGTCVQSPVVCTQSVTSAATICSNLWVCWRADQGRGKGATDNQQDEHQE